MATPRKLRTFELSITPEPPLGWGPWERIREVIQNGLDAQDQGFPLQVIYQEGAQRLLVRNVGANITPAALVTGHSTKREVEGLRGRHGDGLKTALQVSLYLDRRVQISLQDRVWIPRAHRSEQFDTTVVVVDEYARPGMREPEVQVMLSKVTPEEWAEASRCLLAIQPPKQAVTVPGQGQILLDANHRGLLFSRGIYVGQLPESYAHGYDLLNIELNRDRATADHYQVRDHVRRLLTAAVTAGLLSGDQVLNTMLEGLGEANGFQYDTWSNLTQLHEAVAKAFNERYGDDAVPITNVQEAKTAELLHAKAVEVPEGLRDVLSRVSRVSQLQRLVASTDVRRVLVPNSNQQAMLNWLQGVLPLDGLVQVVDFVSPRTTAHCPTPNSLNIAAYALNSPADAASAAFKACELAGLIDSSYQWAIEMLVKASYDS